ncbi:50S ribosomal protein L3 [bacterium]|nr:50S ribosomal protein L3 [bacterium]
MKKFILGKKLGMTTIYSEDKGALNVTLIECEPNFVSLIRTEEKDKYSATLLKVNKTKNKFHCREFRSEEKDELKKGDKITVDIFQEGDKVKVSGVSKAKGFQGVMKRHGFHGSPHSHGHRHDHRAPGSIGSAYPQHVMKGKKMAGRMGGTKSTVKNLKVVYIDKNKNLLGVKGAVPGVSGRIIEITSQ